VEVHDKQNSSKILRIEITSSLIRRNTYIHTVIGEDSMGIYMGGRQISEASQEVHKRGG
jgi:hypothetical protein